MFDHGQHESDAWMEYRVSSMQISGEFPDIKEYEEYETYNDQGQILSYKSEGMIDWLEDQEKQTIIEKQYIYRDNGTVERIEVFYNSWIFGSYRETETQYYDKMGRPVYTNAYITHGYLEDYYIYEGNKKEPSYCLTLDHMGRDVSTWSFQKL